MRALFLIILLLGTLWDGITTGLGISVAIGANDFLGYGMCFVGGSLVLGFSFFTSSIWSYPGIFGIVMKLVWLLAVIFDFYTSFIGNAKYVILKSYTTDISMIWQKLSFPQLFIIGIITLMVSLSPMVISFLFAE